MQCAKAFRAASDSLEAFSLRSLQEALRKIRETRYDVIISDLSLGREQGAGLQLLKTLRERGDWTPFILFTSSRSLKYQEEALRRGALGIADDLPELLRLASSAIRAGPTAPSSTASEEDASDPSAA
jgi:DNA-binding NtrC family response regulator